MKLSVYFLLSVVLYSCVGTDEITIDKPEVSLDEKIIISSTDQAILLNGEATFSGIYKNAKGETEEVTLEWLSSTPTVATISPTGIATGLAEGGTIISASYQDTESNQIPLNVINEASDLAVMEVSGTTTMLCLSESTSLDVYFLDLEGNQLSGIDYEWISMHEDLATIDSDNGQVISSSTNTGQASFYVIAEGKMSNIYTIEIVDKTAISIRNGVFHGYGGYSVSGNVSLQQQFQGDLMLKFDENFSSAQGPGLVIYLSNSEKKVIEQGVEIKPLGQLSGPFEINISEINPNIMITDYQYVIIHCKPFNVPFGGSPLGDLE
jgi:hypothetical protein